MVTLACLFGAGYVGLLVRLRRASRERGPADRSAIALTCVLALALWLATVSWWLWPWYALWLLPPAALRRPHGRTTVVVAVATCAALLAYLPTNFHLALWPLGSGGMSLTVALLLFLPALTAALLPCASGRQRIGRPESRRPRAGLAPLSPSGRSSDGPSSLGAALGS
ncbi:MAG: hypothetical protein U0531_18890 [Dehalococcoidia bacterium]